MCVGITTKGARYGREKERVVAEREGEGEGETEIGGVCWVSAGVFLPTSPRRPERRLAASAVPGRFSISLLPAQFWCQLV